jgi:hypothetical protein
MVKYTSWSTHLGIIKNCALKCLVLTWTCVIHLKPRFRSMLLSDSHDLTYSESMYSKRMVLIRMCFTRSHCRRACFSPHCISSVNIVSGWVFYNKNNLFFEAWLYYRRVFYYQNRLQTVKCKFMAEDLQCKRPWVRCKYYGRKVTTKNKIGWRLCYEIIKIFIDKW